MKKIFALTLSLWVSALAYSQSVLGINFSASYEYVKSQLEQRLGEYHVFEEGGNLSTGEIYVGGFRFQSGQFGFQRLGKVTYFNFANFEKYYSVTDVETAKADRDFLFSLLSKKYGSNTDSYISEGYKCYQFGTNPKDDDRWLGLITLGKAKGRDGKTRLYLDLTYGPIYYLDSSSEF